MLKILIVDDHSIFSDALISLLNDRGSVEVTATATSGREGLDLVGRHPDTDVLVLDVSMPGMDGVDVLLELRRRRSAVPVLMLSQELSSGTIMRAMKAGTSGYVLKTAGYDEFLTAITAVAGGREYLSDAAQSALIAGLTGRSSRVGEPHLTRREIDVIRLIASGNTTGEIAERLFISAMTVETHRRNLMQKLQLKNVAGLVRYAMEQGLAEE
jgi:DNA-binding NarL/FixJ family response regulator